MVDFVPLILYVQWKVYWYQWILIFFLFPQNCAATKKELT